MKGGTNKRRKEGMQEGTETLRRKKKNEMRGNKGSETNTLESKKRKLRKESRK